jgi:hypothetical protein
MKVHKELNTMYDDTCIKVYDPKEKKLIAVFKNYIKAANKLGLSTNVILRRCAKKKRVFSPTLQKEIALRISVVKPEDIPLMEKNQLIN